jgi:hypothetical protein
MTIDPNTNLDNYIKFWEEAQKQYGIDVNSLATMIQQMLALAKQGKIDQAFQVAQMQVLPGTMQVQGDSIGGLASSLNISSALLEFTTDAQNAINAGKDMTPDQAAKFVKYLQDFFNHINPAPSWLTPSTQSQLNDAISKICKVFGVSNPSQLDPAKVQKEINAWSKDPTKDGGQQHLQELQAGFTQWNNTEAAQSQGLQAQTQFATNTFNQYMNIVKGVLQSTQEQLSAIVRNLKSS